MIVKETRVTAITDKHQTNENAVFLVIWIITSQIPTVKGNGINEILLINFFLLSSKCPKGVSLAQWLWPSNNGWNKVDVLKRLSQISDIKKGIKIGRQRTALKDFVNLWTYLLYLCKMKKLFCLLYFLLIFMLILYWKSRYSVTLQQALSSDFQHTCGKMHT